MGEKGDAASEVEQRGKAALDPAALGRAYFNQGNREEIPAWGIVWYPPGVKRYLEDGEEALEPKNGNPYAALHTSKSLSEVDRLRLIIASRKCASIEGSPG